jgi:peptidoglycan/LPS O-acetylase OafA/YrhL
MLFCAIAFCLANGAGAGLIVNRYIGFIGKISYSGYLCHFAILEILLHLADRGIDPIAIRDPGHGLTFLCFFAPCFLAATLLASTITYHVVERPMIRLGAHLLMRRRAANKKAPPADAGGATAGRPAT